MSRATIIERNTSNVSHPTSGSVAIPAVLRDGYSGENQYSMESLNKAHFSKPASQATGGGRASMHVSVTLTSLTFPSARFLLPSNRKGVVMIIIMMISDDDSKSQTVGLVIIIALFGRVKVLRTLGMGSAALPAAVPCQVRHPEFPARDDKVPTKQNKTKCQQFKNKTKNFRLKDLHCAEYCPERPFTIHSKLFNRTKHANFQGNPLYQATKWHSHNN